MTSLVRPARPEDRERLGELAGQLVRLHSDWNSRRFLQIPNVEEGYGRWLVKQAEDANGNVLVAERASRVVGYLYARFEANDWNALLGPHAALHDLFVDPAERGGGLATRLLEDFRAECKERKVPRIVLHTAVQNEGAQRLFRKFGFESTMIEMTYEIETSARELGSVNP